MKSEHAPGEHAARRSRPRVRSINACSSLGRGFAAALALFLLLSFTAPVATSTNAATLGSKRTPRAARAVQAAPDAAGGDAPEAPDTGAPVPSTPRPPNVTGRPPNELGRVLIMEYHRIKNPEAPWQRTPDGFRRDLQRLYDAGFRSVALSDVLANHIALPLGTSPVVLTFDDSYVSQLWWTETGVPAADSAVGILEQFAALHPDFGQHGVFYVTWSTLFGGPPAAGIEKLRYLVQHGFELGNHTMNHANLGLVGSATAQQELAQEQSLVRQALGGYEMQTMALPYGAWPRERNLGVTGGAGGASYRFAAVLQVGSEPAPSPASRAFNPIVLPRVQAGEALLSYWLNWFDTHPDERYVSDGDPNTVTFPARLAPRLRPDVQQRVWVKAY